MLIKFYPCVLVSSSLKEPFKGEFDKGAYMCRIIFKKDSPNTELLYNTLLNYRKREFPEFANIIPQDQKKQIFDQCKYFLYDGDNEEQILGIGLDPNRTIGSYIVDLKRREDLEGQIEFYYDDNIPEEERSVEPPSGQVISICASISKYCDKLKNSKEDSRYKNHYRLLIREIKIFNKRVEPFFEKVSFKYDTEKEQDFYSNYIQSQVLLPYGEIEPSRMLGTSSEFKAVDSVQIGKITAEDLDSMPND